jgi:hypothetical protein
LTRHAAQSTGGGAPDKPFTGVDDAVLDDLVGIWSEALSVSEDFSRPDDGRAAACHEWLILLSAPILKEIRLQGSSAIAKHDREVDRVYRRLITGRRDDFPHISASR